VDLITNSSTEIYIEATDKTIESLKNIINSILKVGGSKLTSDDLFTIELNPDDIEETKEYSDYDYKSISLIVKCKDENSELGKTTAKLLSNLTGIFHIEAAYNG
jgi:hypothetical protein